MSKNGSTGAAAASRASTTLSRPASTLLLSKPFRCPKPNCNKSYKQANGLKYHMTHGSCNFAPPKDLEALQALLAEKSDGMQMSEGEMREVEREAERRLRPFACGVSDCQRRYKNMNGLRTWRFLSQFGNLAWLTRRAHTGYHYQHSGEHGATGLRLLASGQHECLQHTKSAAASRHATPGSGSTSATSTPATTPSTPTFVGAQQSAWQSQAFSYQQQQAQQRQQYQYQQYRPQQQAYMGGAPPQ